MIQTQGWVELYVRRRLAPADSAAFEDHYFSCDRCFAEVLEMQRFVSGMHDAGERGLLGGEPDRQSRRWLAPAFVLAAAASVLLAVGLTYTALVRLPRVQSDLEAAVAKSNQSEAQVAEFRRGLALATRHTPEANVPVAILNANRSVSEAPPRLSIPASANTVLLWIDIPPQPAGAKFRIEIAANGNPAKTIHGLERNENGALAAAVPVADLPAGTYVVRLYAERAPGAMIAEYRMTVARN